MSFQPVGPAHLLIGDPTTASGADMYQLGLVRDVGFDAGIRSAWTSNDDIGGAPVSDGIYTLASQPEVQADLSEAGVAQLTEIILGATVTTGNTDDVLGLPDSFASVAESDVPTLCLLPSQQDGDGESAANAIWLPAVAIQGVDGLSFGRVEEGEIDQPYNTSFQSAYRDTDQGATAIPAGNRLGFMGPPAELGLSWSLPTIN